MPVFIHWWILNFWKQAYRALERTSFASEQGVYLLGGFLFCSGQIGLDPGSGGLVAGSVADQTQQALENLVAVCRSAGTSLERAARITVYVARIEDLSAVNAVYERHFGDDPARVTVGVAALPAGAEIELDAVVPLD